MKSARLLLCCVALTTAPASAFWFNGGLKQTAGSGGYYGTTGNVTLGYDDLSVRPQFTTYRSDSSEGTYRSAQARVGYDTKVYGFGATGGGTNEVDGYQNRFFGFDATLSLTPSGRGPQKRISGQGDSSGPARGRGLLRFDLGAEVRFTRHTDVFTATPGTRSKIARRLSGREFVINQTDVTGSAGVSFLDNLLSVDVTKSSYDREIGANLARASGFVALRGVGQVVQGFPDVSWTARGETSVLPVVTPYAQYTRTRFLIGQPDSHSTSFGGFVELGIVEVSASWDHYTQSGLPAQNYFSAGANLRF